MNHSLVWLGYFKNTKNIWFVIVCDKLRLQSNLKQIEILIGPHFFNTKFVLNSKHIVWNLILSPTYNFYTFSLNSTCRAIKMLPEVEKQKAKKLLHLLDEATAASLAQTVTNKQICTYSKRGGLHFTFHIPSLECKFGIQWYIYLCSTFSMRL